MSNDDLFLYYFYKIKSPSVKAKGLGIVSPPLVDSFRTFKGDMSIEKIRLNQLILQY